MSWFSDLAGRAEALLNQVDQAASTSLQEAGLSTPHKAQPSQTSPVNPPSSQDQQSTSLPYEPTVHTINPNQGAAVAQVLVGSASGSSLIRKTSPPVPFHTSTPKPKPSPPTTKDKSASDEKLFEFLNSPSKPKDVSSRPKTSLGHTRKASSQRVSKLSAMPRNQSSPVLSQPSVTGVKSEGGVSSEEGERKKVVRNETKQSVEKETYPQTTIMATPIDTVEDTDSPQDDSHAIKDNTVNEFPYTDQILTTADHGDPIPDVLDIHQDTGDHPEGICEPLERDGAIIRVELDNLKQTVSNYELENKLLKREVSCLNDELSSVMSKLNGREDNEAHYESEIHALREQASRTDHMIRQLRSHDEDLQASLDARDSQIQVLRVRLSEADRTVEDQQRQLNALSAEKERFLQDANLSSTAHSHALDSIKLQLTQTKSLLEQERELFETKRQEFLERESQLQSELTQVSDALTSQQRQVALKQSKCSELQNELQSVHRDVQLMRKEHEDYKLRAAGILQTKEKLISSLQSGVDGAVGGASEAKAEEIRLEKEHIQAQLQTAYQHIENLKTDIQESEDRHIVELENLTEQVRVCEGVLAEERKQHSLTRGEVTRLTQEVEDYRESLLKEKTTTTELLQRNETELSSLKTQLSSTLSPSRAEQEARLHELTDSLIHKQTALETLSAEKNSLNLQLQRLQAQLTESQKVQTSPTQTAVVMNGLEQADTHSDTTRIRPMASVLSSLENAPTDSRLHNVKKAVNVVDKFSIRLGVFLRRYPHARLFALLYMVLLHVWVMVVLLTYTPETHDMSDFHQL